MTIQAGNQGKNVLIMSHRAWHSVMNFMAHVSALGMEFGGPFRGFVELGFGERGMLTAGVRYKF